MAVALTDRVRNILRRENDEATRVHDAIEEIANDVDAVSRRLATIDPEWELIARQELEPLEQLERLTRHG